LGSPSRLFRERARQDEFEPLGIKVVRLGAQYRVITSSVLACLGVDAADSANSEAHPRWPARQGRATAPLIRLLVVGPTVMPPGLSPIRFLHGHQPDALGDARRKLVIEIRGVGERRSGSASFGRSVSAVSRR
jgi:hypothetical protein